MNSTLWRKVGWAALIVFLAACPISGSRALAKREGFTNEEQMRYAFIKALGVRRRRLQDRLNGL